MNLRPNNGPLVLLQPLGDGLCVVVSRTGLNHWSVIQQPKPSAFLSRINKEFCFPDKILTVDRKIDQLYCINHIKNQKKFGDKDFANQHLILTQLHFHEILFYTQVRAEAWVNEFFYNNTQRGFCETRIINQTLSLRFVGTNPMVFKPGMPFEAQIAVRYHDQVALTQEQLGN